MNKDLRNRVLKGIAKHHSNPFIKILKILALVPQAEEIRRLMLTHNLPYEEALQVFKAIEEADALGRPAAIVSSNAVVNRLFSSDPTYLVDDLRSAMSKHPHNSAIFQAASEVMKQAVKLLATSALKLTRKQKLAITESLILAIDVIKDPQNEDAIRRLEYHANNHPLRHLNSNGWKKFFAGLALVVGAAIIGLSIVGIPFSAGLSTGGIVFGIGLFAAGGATLFSCSKQKSIATAELQLSVAADLHRNNQVALPQPA